MESSIDIKFESSYKMSEYSLVLFNFIIHEINRLKINNNFDLEYGGNITLPFIKMSTYNYDDDINIEDIPNFEAFGVKIFWYKYIGRDMTCNVNFNDDQWAEWGRKVIFTLSLV